MNLAQFSFARVPSFSSQTLSAMSVAEQPIQMATPVAEQPIQMATPVADVAAVAMPQSNMAMQAGQQMQVTVPLGIGPGMPFQVETPSGMMQVICPPGVEGGQQIAVSVPAPVVQTVATPSAVTGTPVMTNAPVPMEMGRAPPPGCPDGGVYRRVAYVGPVTCIVSCCCGCPLCCIPMDQKELYFTQDGRSYGMSGNPDTMYGPCNCIPG